jgi:hypothetical protein
MSRNRAGVVTDDIYKLSLHSCQGVPVTKYELDTVRDTPPGTMYDKAPAYCTDGSGVIFSAKDGKAQTCIAGRTPVQ